MTHNVKVMQMRCLINNVQSIHYLTQLVLVMQMHTTTQQCSANPLYDPACSGYQTAYYNQQCQLDPLI